MTLVYWLHITPGIRVFTINWTSNIVFEIISYFRYGMEYLVKPFLITWFFRSDLLKVVNDCSLLSWGRRSADACNRCVIGHEPSKNMRDIVVMWTVVSPVTARTCVSFVVSCDVWHGPEVMYNTCVSLYSKRPETYKWCLVHRVIANSLHAHAETQQKFTNIRCKSASPVIDFSTSQYGQPTTHRVSYLRC